MQIQQTSSVCFWDCLMSPKSTVCCRSIPPPAHMCVHTHNRTNTSRQTEGMRALCTHPWKAHILSAAPCSQAQRQSTFSTHGTNSWVLQLNCPGPWQWCEGRRHVNTRLQWADWPECTLLSFKPSLQPCSHKPQSSTGKQYAYFASLPVCQVRLTRAKPRR